MDDGLDQTAAQPQPQHNHMRRSTKWVYGLLGASSGGALAFILQMNGLYFTRNEGLNVKSDVAVLSSKIDATNLNLVTAINGLRTDMNTNFSNLQLQLVRDNHAQNKVDEKQDLAISELKLLQHTQTPKTNKKEN